MEGWVDTILCRELEMQSDLIYLPLDSKGTDIAWTQFRQGMWRCRFRVESQTLSRWTIDGGGRPEGICIDFVSPRVRRCRSVHPEPTGCGSQGWLEGVCVQVKGSVGGMNM